MGLLRTFWWENEPSKLFGFRYRILPKYGHGRGHFWIFSQYLKFVMPLPYEYDVFQVPTIRSEISSGKLMARILNLFQLLARLYQTRIRKVIEHRKTTPQSVTGT